MSVHTCQLRFILFNQQILDRVSALPHSRSRLLCPCDCKFGCLYACMCVVFLCVVEGGMFPDVDKQLLTIRLNR